MSSTILGQHFPRLRFQRLTDKDGLADNSIFSITQDRDGIIWLGTANGLNRFDGSKIKKFQPLLQDTNSLAGGPVWGILVNDHNNLWMSTGSGLAFMNTQTNRINRFRHKENDSSSFKNDDKPAIILGTDNLPWVATRDGVYRFRDSMHYARISTGVIPFEYFGELADHYRDIYITRQNQLWGTVINRVYEIDNRTGRVTKESIMPFSQGIRKACLDKSGRLWLTTWGAGLFVFTPTTGECKHIAIGNSNPYLNGIAEWKYDGEEYMVVSTGQKILLINQRDFSWKDYSPGDLGEILDVTTIYVDKQNILWLGSNQGLFFISPSSLLFDIIPVLNPAPGQSETVSFVYNLVETKDSYWFTKRYNNGIYQYSKNWELKKHWQELVPRSKNKFGTTGATLEGYDFKQVGSEMFITTESGMVIMNLADYSCKIIYTEELQIPPRLRTIVPENDTSWWVRSFSNGVFIFNPVKKKFTRHYTLSHNKKDEPASRMNYMLRTKKGEVFATTEGGLYKYDKTADKFTPVATPATDSLTILSSLMMGMTEDDSGWVWIGTSVGMIAFDPEIGRIVKIFSGNPTIGLVLRVCTDRKQNLWFNSITTGYWCWLRERNKLVNFGYNLGLPFNDESTFESTSDGLVYGGGANAITKFYPDRLMNYRNVPGVKILETSVNQTFTPIEHTASGDKQLVMSPGTENITVDFAVINYDFLANNRYYYRLMPGNKGWQESENGHLVFYNLPSGRYQLEVKGTNILSGSSSPIDSISLVVLPNWYQTGWFKVLLIACIAALIIIFVWRRINTIKKEAGFRQKIAETEMQALRAQMNPHFIFNSLNSIENFIMQNDKRQASDYLNKFSRLIRNILDSSMGELVLFSRDIEALQLYVDLEQLRLNNKFNYKVNVDPELMNGDYRVPSLLIQPYVENAIVHGLAGSNAKNLNLVVTVLLEDNHIKYVIEDNGIGRKQAGEYKRYNRPQHKSVGLKITEDRIVMFNHTKGIAGSHPVITDLWDENGKPAGTKVEIKIKAA